LLLIFQGMDAAGKDGAIRHVMSGVNPRGCQISSFRQSMKIQDGENQACTQLSGQSAR
jgi:polyphosphate kinase 2 (PPK2 family)